MNGAPLKMVVDSVHQSTLILILDYFNMSSSNCAMNYLYKMKPYCIHMQPDYGSNLIFELHKEVDAET